MIEPTEEEVEEFLLESNKIEREYSNIALQDANQAWIMSVLNFKKDFSIDLICGIHRRLAKRLNPRIAGKIRKIPVYVGNYKEFRECLKPELILDKLQELITRWNFTKDKLKGMPASTKEAFIKQWHIDFEGVHPYEDFNGRTGRIIMNLMRLSINLPLLIIYDKEKQEYYKWFKGLK